MNFKWNGVLIHFLQITVRLYTQQVEYFDTPNNKPTNQVRSSLLIITLPYCQCLSYHDWHSSALHIQDDNYPTNCLKNAPNTFLTGYEATHAATSRIGGVHKIRRPIRKQSSRMRSTIVREGTVD